MCRLTGTRIAVISSVTRLFTADEVFSADAWVGEGAKGEVTAMWYD